MQQSTDSSGVTGQTLDAIQIEVLWNRLISIVEEQATVLIRTAFTNIISDAGDLSAGLFDPHGNMIAQAVTGTPGHINSMAIGMRHFLAAYPPETIEPGDVLISNDPHQFSGHYNDFTLATPIYRDGHLVAYFASTCHALDIGGRTFAPDKRDMYEEGLAVPITKYYKAGKPNQDLMNILRGNVRTPDEVLGDLHAQVAANAVGGERLLATMEEFNLGTIEPLAEEILARSERGMRAAIQRLPDGVYTDTLQCDGWQEPLRIKATVTIKGDELTVDFAGSSSQVDYGVNVVLNYTVAYTTYALKAAICPEIPNNEGSFRPVHITAPPGSILNCQRPAPLQARHILGHFAPVCVLGALHAVLGERALAEGATTIWSVYVRGQRGNRTPFASISMMAGGMGARSSKDGLSAAIFPSGIRGTPVEIVESRVPILYKRKELRCDSGGPGTYRGGLGQTVHVQMRSEYPTTMITRFDRCKFPARGLQDGHAGALGAVRRPDGALLPSKGEIVLGSGEEVVLDLPGGGGYGSPLERDPQQVLDDVLNGYVSLQQAEACYGVVIDPETREVAAAATATRRTSLSSEED
jgi:N-methylhydantoinase B